MKEEDLRTVLPPQRRVPADRRADIKEMLMSTIREDVQSTSPVPRQRPRRRLAGGVAVAIAVVGLGSAAAAAMLWDRPDPGQVAVVNDEIGSRSPAASAHTLGWRPQLSSESVQCVLPVGAGRDIGVQVPVIETSASEFPLEGLLTRDILVNECTSGNDLVRSGSETLGASAATVCVQDGPYPKPVVFLEGSSCEQAGRTLRRITDVDLAELNRLRAFDVSVLAVPTDNGCPTIEEASRWAEDRIGHSGRNLRVEAFTATTIAPTGSGCYRGVTDWTRGTVVIQTVGPQPAGSAGFPPTTG